MLKGINQEETEIYSMKNNSLRIFFKLLLTVSAGLVIVSGFVFPEGLEKAGKALTFEDMMGFRVIEDPVISENGQAIAFTARPDRGNPEVVVSTLEDGRLIKHILGSKPLISCDSKWVAAELEIDLVLSIKEKDTKPPLKKGMLLLDVIHNSWEEIAEVKDFVFSKDGSWLAYHRFPPELENKESGDKEKEGVKGEKDTKVKSSTLVLRDLQSGKEYFSEDVELYSFDPQSNYLAFSRTGSEEGTADGIYCRVLGDSPEKESLIQSLPGGEFSSLAWTKDGSVLAYVSGLEGGESYSLQVWRGASGSLGEVTGMPGGWYVPLKNKLEWTDDSTRLYFGLKPDSDKEFTAEKENGENLQNEEQGTEKKPGEGKPPVITGEDRKNAFDIETLLKQKEMDVWHWNDPRIVSNQKERWNDEKDRVFLATVTLENLGGVIQLADLEVPEVSISQGGRYIEGKSQVPYLKMITWEGDFYDLYAIELATGRKVKIAEKTLGDFSISPSGEYAVYYQDGDWHLYRTGSGSTRNLTSGLDVRFADELHDYPSLAPGYGSAGWLEDSSAVFIYDRFDVWIFPADGGAPVTLTQGKGREQQMTFRMIRTDPEAKSWKKGTEILLSSYRDRTKNSGFYSFNTNKPGIAELIEENKKFSFIAKAEKSEELIYTREDYREFPDIWVAGPEFSEARKISDVNPQVADFAWGEAELVEWNSLDGIPLQGVLIKPGNYEEGKRYPVLVYFYRFFSQRLHEFNTPVINHRPSFPLYASNGYAIFLPDIRFEVGRPGFSSTKCLVPGVQKLIDMGIADPKAIGLHGHSWSGYQAAFIVTQTDLFAAAVAGAPVSNMTSAYGGIRWGTGLSRQFQYEESQSRIGGSLWEYPERYIENSPLFFADRINTPLLIMFGDQDDAVPWYQGIELYMAMRRLEKDAVFLQYRGEPHHLKKYPNRLDYAIKMKEYFDHYLKGAAAPEWITKGEPYRGK